MPSVVRVLVVILLAAAASGRPAHAETMTLSLSSSDFVATPVFSNVRFFTLDIEIDEPLQPGSYINPPIIDVAYQVSGTLAPGVPSGTGPFNLQRYMTGAEFYAQGGSLQFAIKSNAVLSDGVQVIELAGSGVVMTVDAREINTGRYTPPQWLLNADSTGVIRNSNNVPSVEPLVRVDFGEEYITNLLFDPGNTTVITRTAGGGFDDDDGTVCIISNIVSGTFLQSGLGRLREFRDKYLLPYKSGQQFVAWYYRQSQMLEPVIARHEALRAVALAVLAPLIIAGEYPVAIVFLTGVLIWHARRRRVTSSASFFHRP